MTFNDSTFLFHDYETWGVDPRFDFACQFAAIRTDQNLQIIGKPISYFCQIPNDYLPHPEACLVTGITPQQSLRDGLIEAEFATKIHQLMSQANTCSLGYNSIKFDDEVSRHLFYRNFFDPYEREYANNNSRWDLIDLARACYALRPNGVSWAYKESGYPSFKLEDLSKANNIEHEDAHDAVSDVKATIEFAKVLKKAQPKLFEYYFALRKKSKVNELIRYDFKSPLIYVSGSIGPQHACTTLILPLTVHPQNPNAVICLDLNRDPSKLFNSDPSQLKELMYSRGVNPHERPGIRVVHVNKSPFLAAVKAMDEEIAERCGLDLNVCRDNLKQIQYQIADAPEFTQKISDIFVNEDTREPIDIDASLYTRGFLSSADKVMLEKIRATSPDDLAILNSELSVPFQTQMFRYRARNFPQTLNAHEIEKWQRHRHMRFSDDAKQTCLSAAEFQQKLVDLATSFATNTKKLSILRDLEKYLVSIY